MRIIGLDLSLTHTGLVVLENGVVRAYATIVPKKLRGVKRLSYIRKELKKVLIAYNPKLAVIEGYAYSPNANMAFSIGENGGIVKRLLYLREINYLIVAPKTLKKFFTGNGNASKDLMDTYAKRDWGAKFETDHEVDAFGLAMLGHYALDEVNGTDKQQEAVKTVLKDEAKQNYFKGGGRNAKGGA